MQRIARTLIAAAALTTFAVVAPAATRTTTFNVTATVGSNCLINSASTLAFGTYTPAGGVIDQTSSVVVRCSSGTTYGIGLSAGSGTGSTIAARKLSSGTVASTLDYNLYIDSGRTTVWENPSNATTVATNQGGTGTGMGIAQSITHTVYGRLEDNTNNQNALPATDYTSTITLTLNY
jgi:spore coat protein U-like protein